MDFSVNPLLLTVIPPSIGDEEKYFSIQVTGEALWQWRQIKPTYPENYFRALNKSLEELSYVISSHASDRLRKRIENRSKFSNCKAGWKKFQNKERAKGKVFKGVSCGRK